MNCTPAGTVAQLHAAQARLDQLAPDDDPEDIITPQQADEIARDTLVETPYIVGYWLREVTDNATQPECWVRLTRALHAGQDLTAPQLLVLLMGGYDSDLKRVRRLLRERFDAAHSEQAAKDAAAILAEQERELSRMEAEVQS